MDDQGIVHTTHGDVICEDVAWRPVIRACGFWVNAVRGPHPAMSLAHPVLLTEPLAGLIGPGRRGRLLRCPIDAFYRRQERRSAGGGP